MWFSVGHVGVPTVGHVGVPTVGHVGVPTVGHVGVVLRCPLVIIPSINMSSV